MFAPAAPAPLSYGPVQKYRYACCGASAAPRSTPDAHVAEPRIAYRVRLEASTAAPHQAHRPFFDEPSVLALRGALGLLQQRPDGAVLVVEALQPRLEHGDRRLRVAGAHERVGVVVHGVGARIDLRGRGAGVHGRLEV